MKPLLARENLPIIAQLAWSNVLLAFDFDGTLAPIVADRDQAAMRERTQELFCRLCVHYPCAVISGRGRDDVAARLSGAAVRHVIGNHGLEPGAGLGEFERVIAEARSRLEESLADSPGVELEDKRYSLALHYRKSRARGQSRHDIQRAIAALPEPMRVIEGKLVTNVMPALAPNKGDALLRLRALEKADTALFVGDDVTDEDVFSLDQPGRLLTVRVGESGTSAARYFLREQREIDALLVRLVTTREKVSRP